MIQFCSCTNVYQDKLYGKGMRVFNISEKNKEVANCTVCNKKGVRIQKEKEDVVTTKKGKGKGK